MDRFAEQLFGSPDKQSRSRAADGAGFMATMAKSFASSAAKRAMESRGGRRSRGAFEAEDFHKLGGLVLEMMSGGGNEGERRRKKRRHRDRERGRGRERETDRGAPPERTREEPVYGSEKRKRRHRGSGSPLHVTFAEPLQDFDYPPPRKRQPRRRHHHGREEEEQAQAPARERRRPRRHGPAIDLRSLRTELEDMSHTIIGLNARSTSHRDCEFYDKFARRGGRLQEVIGSTLGQIRGMEENDGGYGEEEERRERKRRRRERRAREV
ncbi:hypothetical protein AK830_g12251 [Neonectria ditissima]|uniref:Uncharacterized protein n=1 Tax=Neonectria ditissima TaxID=78410 RepID=A0A0N8H4U1_9HYPO|nr:hypothetical protein AK830_g12251 [Neonectria ditissima]